MTSPDGVNWTLRSAPANRSWRAIVFADGLFVASGVGGVATSPDGINWIDYPVGGLQRWESVAYGDGWYVAVGVNGLNNLLTSRDGVTWTVSSAPEPNEWTDIVFGSGRFLAIGRQGDNRVMIGTPRSGIGDEPVFLPLSPNWAQPLRESYEFKTDIITSWDGKEQRRAVRFNPRIEIDFLAHLHGWTKSQLDQFMAARQPRETWLPRFVQFATSTISMPPEATVLAVSGDTSWLTPGMTVALYDGRGKLESRVVASVGAGTISFTGESMTEFPIGSRISPVYRGRIQVTPKVERLTNDIATMRVQFSVDPGSFTYVPAPGDSFVDFREAFMRGPNWGGGVTLDHVWPRETVDYEFGRVEHFVPYDFPSRITRMNFVGRDKDDVKSAIDFFWRHRGRWKEFVMPTWENDVPYAFIAAGSRSILVDGTDFGAAYADSTVYRRIVLRLADGTFHHRAVDFVDVLQDTDTSVLWTTEDLPTLSLTPSTMFGISWGLVSRLASDRLDIDWLTDSVAQFSLTFQSLENFDIQ
ncbi:WD40/YVTN/BNR-like repeat-containing protein [Neoaquamicrobium sediminum]|nr:hypothetical protein [Mesorhizobium sediminum]NRC54130.1 hypothetical protein [Mesorhizobium sediminum]